MNDTDNMVNKKDTKLRKLLITDIKPCELKVESDVYTNRENPKIPCLGYKGIIGVITKIILIEGTYNLWGQVVLGL